MIKCSHALSFSNEKEQSKFNDSFSKNSSFHSIFSSSIRYIFHTEKFTCFTMKRFVSLMSAFHQGTEKKPYFYPESWEIGLKSLLCSRFPS